MRSDDSCYEWSISKEHGQEWQLAGSGWRTQTRHCGGGTGSSPDCLWLLLGAQLDAHVLQPGVALKRSVSEMGEEVTCASSCLQNQERTRFCHSGSPPVVRGCGSLSKLMHHPKDSVIPQEEGDTQQPGLSLRLT